MAYIVQSIDLFGFRNEFVANHEACAEHYKQGLEALHGNKYRIIKQ